MPPYLGYVSFALNAVLAAIAIVQALRTYGRRKTMEGKRGQVEATQMGLAQLRAALCEAVERGDVIKAKAQRQLVALVGHHIKSVEHHIDSLLATWPQPKVKAAKS